MVGIFILKNRNVLDWERKLQTGALILFCISVGILCIWHLAGGSGGEGSWFNQNLAHDFHDHDPDHHVRNEPDSKICPR